MVIAEKKHSLQLKLDAQAENRRRRLLITQAPIIRHWLILFTLICTSLANGLIYQSDLPLAQQLIQSVVATLAVPIAIWLLASLRYTSTLGGISETLHTQSGNYKTFTYQLTEQGIAEIREGTTQLFSFGDYLGHKQQLGEAWLVFRKGLIYLPSYGVQHGSITGFIKACEQSVQAEG